MSVYKPTNCRPFAGAVDITKIFLRIEKENDAWNWVLPEPIYASCRLETTNTNVVGYRVSLYEGDNAVFVGGAISPISELPKNIGDDKTANTGINGTYLRIPLFRPSSTSTTERSVNSIYGEWGKRKYPGILADYLIAERITQDGVEKELPKSDDSAYWDWDPTGKYFSPNNNIAGIVISSDKRLIINGGCEVTENDVVLVMKPITSGEGEEQKTEEKAYLCVLEKGQEDTPVLKSIKDISELGNEPIYIRKGSYSNFYSRKALSADSYNGVLEEANWNEALGFVLVTENDGGALVGNWSNLGVVDLESNTFSWKVDLYQGPRDYADLKDIKIGNETWCRALNIDGLPRQQYDMTLASGTILGSCSKRLHLRSTVLYQEENGYKYRLPGYDMTTPPVLFGSFCEIASGDGTSKMIPSFPISSYDVTLGTVYPKDGSLTEESLQRFGPKKDNNGNIIEYPKASFYKYSSNEEDTLSNEKVLVCYQESDDQDDPRDKIRKGEKLDDVVLASGDRVLWNTLFEQGAYNGIWVVGDDESEPPYRPADGDNWSDYIGKVSLVTDGSFKGTVMESTATAGTFELGKHGLFFRKQTPIRLFGEENMYVPGTTDHISFMFIDELDAMVDARDYISDISSETSYVLTPLPVLDNTTLFGTKKGVVALKNNKEFLDVRITSRDPGSRGDGYIWIQIGKVSGEDSAKIYVAGREDTYYKVIKGFNADSFWTASKDGETSVVSWNQSDCIYSADILFNDVTHTYVSPTASALSESYLKLRDGAEAKFHGASGDYGDSYIKILSYDPITSCVEHAQLVETLQSSVNVSAAPSTPYKYDIKSCCRGSDVNGFVFAPILTPVINEVVGDQQIVAQPMIIKYGHDVELSADIFAPTGIGWREGRWIFGSDSNRPQDTGWFHNGSTNCVFLGLDPADTRHVTPYEAAFYARDEWGRVSTAKITVDMVTTGGPAFPGELKAESDCSTQSVLISYIPKDYDPMISKPDEEWITGGFYDLYRREYAEFWMEGCPYPDQEPEQTLLGPWEPVAIGVKTLSVRDFNIAQGRSYQYAILPRSSDDVQKNFTQLIANGEKSVFMQWSDWSLTELSEVDPATMFSETKRHPAVKKIYEADLNNIWLFKYDVEEGSQTINLMKNEFNSMGEFPRYFGGKLNAESGDISCWLGSEIAKGGPLGYVERRRRAIFSPLAVNEAVAMLADWRKVVKSDKPKLLRDRKGRSWIVQISSGSSTTQGLYSGRPTKISFSWKQIGDPADATIIYGDGQVLNETGRSGVWNWAPKIKKQNDE